MTRLASGADHASATPAPPAQARSRRRCLTDLLADPRVRLGAGTAALLATAMIARRDRVGSCETAAFRAVNGLPDSLYPPAWAVMQLGSLGAVPAAAGLAWLAGDRELAGRLFASGTGAWALSKAVKRIVRRPRPASLVRGTHRRGREAAGLGYLSGHAGVAVALGAAVLPRLGRAGRALSLSAVPAVGLTRVYVGAHLPLDVVGGAALGLAIDAAVTLVSDGDAPVPPVIPNVPVAPPLTSPLPGVSPGRVSRAWPDPPRPGPRIGGGRRGHAPAVTAWRFLGGRRGVSRRPGGFVPR